MYETALHSCREDETQTAAHLMNGRAALCYLLGEHATNAMLARRALGLFERYENPVGKVASLLNLSIDADIRADDEESERLTRTALEIAHSHQLAEYIDSLVMNLTIAEFVRGNYEIYIQQMDIQLQSVRQRGIRSAEAWICHNIVGAFVAIGDIEQAQVYAEAGLEAAQSIQMRRKTGDLCAQLAVLAFLNGDVARAREYQLQALDHDIYANVGQAVGEDHACLAAIEARRSDVDSARHYWGLTLGEIANWNDGYRSEGYLVAALCFAPFVAIVTGKLELATEIGAAIHSYALKNPWSKRIVDVALPELRAQLSPEAFEAAWARGAAYTLDELIAAAQRI